MNELSGRIGRARFLRLGWWKAAVTATPTPQPTVTHGKRAVVKFAVNGSMVNMSQYLQTFSLEQSAAPIKTSQLTGASHSYVPGLIETKIPFTGLHDPTFAQSLDAIQKSAPTQFEYYPAGTATGNYLFSGTALLKTDDTQSDSSKANEISGELTMSGSPSFTTV